MAARPGFAGASLALSILSVALGVFAAHSPTAHVLGPLARMLDAFAPLLLGFGAIFAGLAVLLGARLFGGVLLITAVFVGGQLYLTYRDLTAPFAVRDAVRVNVLFFNARAGDETRAEKIVRATLAADPDIAVFAEASAVLPAVDQLRAAYSFVSPCTEEACELLVATNFETLRFWTLPLGPIWGERYGVMEFQTPSGDTAFLSVSHLVKPWMSGISEVEIARLAAQYNWLKGPVIAVGDFNMPPWSKPMRQVLEATGFKALSGQSATWPVSSSFLGLPIDQVLVRGGPRVAGFEPFGHDLGSNHLGFVAEISMPGQDHATAQETN